MISFFITHPATIAFMLLFVFAAGSSAAAKHEFARADHLQVELSKANDTIAEANRIQQLSEKASNENQKRISDLNRKLRVVRVQQPVCVFLPGASPGRPDGPTIDGKPVGQVVVNSSWADELIAEGETYRSQLISLQEWCK